MELKRDTYVLRLLDDMQLLIVPYGIETEFFHGHRYHVLMLLIVPYGIETTFFVLGPGIRKTF